MTIISTENKSLRTDELNRAVSAACKKAVADSQVANQTSITSNQELVAQFIQIMSTNISGNSDFEIEVMGADFKEGLLDVLVTEKFKYVNGKQGSVSVRKCAIAE